MWQPIISVSCALLSPGLLGVCSDLGLLLVQWVQQLPLCPSYSLATGSPSLDLPPSAPCKPPKGQFA